jgi:hypothetical protein
VARASLALAACLLISGCVNTLAIASKVFLGDPKQVNSLQMATGTSLVKSDKTVLTYCTVASEVSDEFGALASDVQEELIQRFKKNHIAALPPDTGLKEIENLGRFEPEQLGQELQGVDYILHIEIDNFTLDEANSPDLYHCRSHGTISCYEVRVTEGNKSVVQVLGQEFVSEYPSHPQPKEQSSANVFYQRSVDRIADSLGGTLYDIPLSQIYAR